MKKTFVWLMISLLGLSVFIAPISAADNDSFDTLVTDDLMYPMKIASSGSTDYIFDQGELLRLTADTKISLAKIADLYPALHKKGIRKADLPTFRPTELLIHKDAIYISGVIHRNWNGTGAGANYWLIAVYQKEKLSIVTMGRGQDNTDATITDWELDDDSGVIFYKGAYLFDYLRRDWTQPAMAIFENKLYFVYSMYDGVNGLNAEGLGQIDLTDPLYPMKVVTEGYGFDTMSGAFTRGDYWQGNGKNYTLLPDAKGILITDGHENQYRYDLARKKMTRVSHWYDSDHGNRNNDNFMNLTNGKLHNGKLYFLNNNGIFVQEKPTKRPVLVFNPKEMAWDNGIPTSIADWDFIDDDHIAILDYDNHRVVHLAVTWE